MVASLEVKEVSYIDKGAIILDKVSFNLKQGEILTIVGPNGAGKSTLINSLVGIIKISKGEVNFPLYDKLGKEPIIGYVPQHSPSKYINSPLTVEEFINLSSVPYRKWPRDFFGFARKSVLTILDDLDIQHLKCKRIDEISGGEFQKVMIASALFLNPDIIILDEPSIGLDNESRKKILDILINLASNLNCSIIIVSHDIEVITTVSSNVLYLDRKVKFLGKLGDYCAAISHRGCFETSDNHLIWHNH